MTRHTGNLRVVDELDRVRPACVLGDARVVEVHVVVRGVVAHVFEHAAKTQGVENLRLVLTAQMNGLGVAPAFDVEHPGVGPDVLVVADQRAVGVGAQRRFAGARQTKEHAAASGRRVGGGRAVHRQVPFFRHQVVHHREDAFLHFTCVFRAQNHDLLLAQVHVHAGAAGHARGQRVGGKSARVKNRPVRLAKACGLFLGGTDQHRPHKQRVIRTLAHHPHLDAVVRVPAREGVDDVQPRPGGQIVDRPAVVDVKGLLLDGDVDRSPPHVVCGARVTDDAFVFGRAAGLAARVSDQRPRIGDRRALVVADRFFVKRRGREVA